MKLSTKGRYGTRAMLALSLHYDKDIIRLKDIAEREGIPARYLEQLIVALKIAGLVKSFRGVQGGYTLARPPDQIRLSEILQVLEGRMAPVECVDDPKACPHSSFCVARDIWLEMKKALVNILESSTLQDLIERKRNKECAQGLMYYI